MPHHAPRLDCGCPALPRYTLRRGRQELVLCGHHGDRLKAEAIRQGFIVTEVARAKAPA